MARRVGKSDPALSIDFWISGFYTHRSQLFAPFKGIGVNVVSFHDPVIDGQNMEDTDLFEWQRRPGFSKFCTEPLDTEEIVNQFYFMRNTEGEVVDFIDSTERLATFTTSAITTIFDKSTTEQGFVSSVGDFAYFSDGAAADFMIYDTHLSLISINPSVWGLPAPTVVPTIFNRGCWLPFSNFNTYGTSPPSGNAILDPNGNVEVVTKVFAAGNSGISGATQPLWPLSVASTINDGNLQWTNEGPLLSWQPDTAFPVPVVILDINGNLQLCSATTNTVANWNAGTTYNVGDDVFFAGNFWTSLVSPNVGVAPSENYIVTTGSTQQPFWVLAQNPITTGSVTPTWSTTVGDTTSDGSYNWINLGPGHLVESFGTSYVYCIRTIYGHLSTASPISANTGSIFGPQVATITSFTNDGTTTTFQGTNNFVPGSIFTVSGFTSPVGLAMNGQTLTVISSGLSATQFKALFTYPGGGTSSAGETGVTQNLVAIVSGRASTSLLTNATATISAISMTAGVITVTCTFDPAPFAPGLFVTFANTTVNFLNNNQFQVVSVDPNGTFFQVFYQTSQGITPADFSVSSVGTAEFNAVEIYRVSDGGGIYLFAGAVTNPGGGSGSAFDTGDQIAQTGTSVASDTYQWANPGNVSSASLYSTVTVPSGGAASNFFAVQTCGIAGGVNSPGDRTRIASFGSNVTGGNSILVYTLTYAMPTWTVSDSQGNNYIQVGQSAGAPGSYGNVTVTAYLATNVAAGATQVRLAFTDPSNLEGFAGMIAVECAGLTGAVDVTNGSAQTTGQPVNTGTITTTNADDVIFSMIWSDSSTATPPAGFVNESTQSWSAFGVQQQSIAYQVVSATGTFSPTWSRPNNNKAVGLSLALNLSTFTTNNELDAQNFEFNVLNNQQVTGIEIDLEALASLSGFASLQVQLLRSGAVFGSPKTVNLTTSNVPYVFGGAGDLWGGVWMSSDFNSAAWGVAITGVLASGASSTTFSVRNVRARLTGIPNQLWVFDDFTPDEDLDILLIAPQNHQNDPPPGAPGSSVPQIGGLTTYWQGRLWMIAGNYVYFTAGPDCTNGDPNSSWPPANRFAFAGPPIGLEVTADGVAMLVYLADRVNAISGGPETISFYPTDALSNFGISNPNALFRDGSILGQFTTQRQYFDIVGGQKEETGQKIADYLSANFAPQNSYLTMHRNGEDVGVFISNGVDQVLRFGSNIQAWSVPAFPLGGAGALRSVETSVGIMSLMLAPPTGGSTTTLVGPLNAGTGTNVAVVGGAAWSNPSNIALNDPASPTTIVLNSTGGAAPTLVETFTASGNGNSLSIPLPSVQIGDLVVIQTTARGAFGARAPIDDHGNSYTPLGASNFECYYSFPFITSAGPGITITQPFDDVTDYDVIAQVFRGLTNFVPDASPDIFTASSGGALSLGGITVPTGPDYIIEMAGSVGSTPVPNQTDGSTTIASTGGSRMTHRTEASPGTYSATFDNLNDGINTGIGALAYQLVGGPSTGTVSDLLSATNYGFNIPANAAVLGLQVQVTGLQTVVSNTTQVTVTTTSGGTVRTFNFGLTSGTASFGGSRDLWGLNLTPAMINSASFGLIIQVSDSNTGEQVEFDLSAAQITVWYSFNARYIQARDLDSWGDAGDYGENNGTPYPVCNIVVGSITLSQPGAEMFPLQHVVGYFDAVGTLNNGGSSYPDIWILPNEVNDTKGIGFVYLPSDQILQEPPTGQNQPSTTLLALRWPVNMMNSSLASQFVHHLQVKIQFEPENAPNTIKSLAFKENQD
jgi:hypothetical protein